MKVKAVESEFRDKVDHLIIPLQLFLIHQQGLENIHNMHLE
jgi:hypothetical protein